MKYSRYIALFVIVTVIVISAWLVLPTPDRLTNTVYEQDIAQDYQLVGVKNIPGERQKAVTYHYFLLLKGNSYKGQTPFLITTDPFIQASVNNEKELHIISHGKIEQYNNDLWIKMNNGKVHHWYVSLNSSYVR